MKRLGNPLCGRATRRTALPVLSSSRDFSLKDLFDFRGGHKIQILPGGPQNTSSDRNFGLAIQAFVTRVSTVGFRKAWSDLGKMNWEFNFGETTGTFRGMDQFGNKYYENLNHQKLRHRWVEYAAPKREYDASHVPAEWHGWLHYTTRRVPGDPYFPKMPTWQLRHMENHTGTDKAWRPRNYGAQKFKPLYTTWDYKEPGPRYKPNPMDKLDE